MRDLLNIVNESTGAECELIEITPGEWWYFLEIKWHGDDEERWGDWQNDMTAGGPFETYPECWEGLRQNHANPGGHNTIPFPQSKDVIDERYIKAIAEAKKRNEQEAQRYSGFSRWR